MNRQNLFSDAWDGDDEEDGTRHRVFWRPDDARMGATLYELAPDASGMRMDMHLGAEEMFFVLRVVPSSGTSTAKRSWLRATSSSAPRDGRTDTFSNPAEEPAQILAISAGSSGRRRLSRTRIRMGGDRDPDPELLARGGDPGIITRFEIPIE